MLGEYKMTVTNVYGPTGEAGTRVVYVPWQNTFAPALDDLRGRFDAMAAEARRFLDRLGRTMDRVTREIREWVARMKVQRDWLRLSLDLSVDRRREAPRRPGPPPPPQAVWARRSLAAPRQSVPPRTRRRRRTWERAC